MNTRQSPRVGQKRYARPSPTPDSERRSPTPPPSQGHLLGGVPIASPPRVPITPADDAIEPRQSQRRKPSASPRERSKLESKSDSDSDADEEWLPSGADADVESSSKSESELDRRGKDLYKTGQPLTAFTLNLAKFGDGTEPSVKASKREVVARMLELWQPAFMALQEVTNPERLFQGKGATRRRAADPGLAQINVMALEASDSESDSESKSQPSSSSSSSAADLPGPMPELPVEDDYALLHGPSFESGTYHEHYSLIYNRRRVVGVPQLYHYDPEQKKLVEAPGNQAVHSFSSKAKKTRPLPFWSIALDTSDYHLRPEVRGRKREREVTNVLAAVVHTSPSINVKGEVDDILAALEQVRLNEEKSNTPRAILALGDFYMQRANPKLYEALQQGARGWRLLAPPTHTNFPHKGSGQTADHAVLQDERVSGLWARAIGPGRHGSVEDATEAPQEQLANWPKKKMDHAPVALGFTLPGTSMGPPQEDEDL